jgi:hypothetical protein
MEELEKSRSEFVQALGYRNLERGLRRLEPWLDCGDGYHLVLKQIAAAYPGHADDLQRALSETTAIKAAEAEAVFLERCKAEDGWFTPYIHAEGETTVPNGICIFGITGGHARWTTVQVSQSILELPLEAQLAALPDLMRWYLRKYRGQCPFFGAVMGFRFVRLVDYFQFDRHGVFLENVQKPFRCGQCSVQLL